MAEWPEFRLQDWLAQRLALEGARLWTDSERMDFSEKLARMYRPGSERTWYVKDGGQRQDAHRSVYVVFSGEVEAPPVESEEKASAIVRTLQALDSAWSEQTGTLPRSLTKKSDAG
jgi:hypothetical protein